MYLVIGSLMDERDWESNHSCSDILCTPQDVMNYLPIEKIRSGNGSMGVLNINFEFGDMTDKQLRKYISENKIITIYFYKHGYIIINIIDNDLDTHYIGCDPSSKAEKDFIEEKLSDAKMRIRDDNLKELL